MKKEVKPITTIHWRIKAVLADGEELAPVPVNADTWEKAVQAAAEIWGVPFARVAAYCEAMTKRAITLSRCSKCGRTVHDNTDKDGYCDACRKAVTAEKAELRRRMRKHWGELPKRPAARRNWRG